MKLNALIRKYKNYLLVAFFIISSIFVVSKVILPQIEEIKAVSADIEKKKEVVANLQTTLNVLNSMTTEEINENFDLSNAALPHGKDLVLIFDELLSASRRAGVELGDLKIRVGDVYSRNKKEEERAPEIGSPALNFSVGAAGGTEELKKFASILYQTVPLTEVVRVSISEDAGEFVANFFYNPIVFKSSGISVPAKPLSEREKELLDQLREWKKNSVSVASDTLSAPNEALDQITVVSPTPLNDPNSSPAPTVSITISSTPDSSN